MNLEPSSQVCYESFHVELIKALSVILLRVKEITNPELYSKQIIYFLREFSTQAVDNATREWACYSLTLICLKIIENGSPDLLKEAESSAGVILPLILQHSHQVTRQDLVRQTVSNLIKLYEFFGRNSG